MAAKEEAVNRSRDQRLIAAAWFLLVILLPITSFTPLAKLAGSSAVAAASTIPLLILLAIGFLPAVLRGDRLPYPTLPLLAFVAAALIAAAAAFFLPIPTFRNLNLVRSEAEALITLAIGACFYLVAASTVRSTSLLKNLFAWLNLSGIVIIVWSLVQAVSWYLTNGYPEWMGALQAVISASGNLYPQRATGLAYEPSWLAHQLNMLYLPYWLAATVFRGSAHSFRIFKKISLENLLLAGGIVVLFLSLSRVGWLAFLVVVAYLILEMNIRLVRWIRTRMLSRFQQGWIQKFGPRMIPVVLVVLLIVLYAALFLGTGYVLSKVDYRMAKLFSPELLKEGGFTEISNQLMFAERVVFWRTGLDIFNDFPILGVGPGNVGYFFPQKMVYYGWGLTETSLIMFTLPSLPNVKSLWVRLLAETGIIGFSIFVTWLFALYLSARRLIQNIDPFMKVIGWMGMFIVVALLIEGFSVDTFALPYFWIGLGWVTAAAYMARLSPSVEEVHGK